MNADWEYAEGVDGFELEPFIHRMEPRVGAGSDGLILGAGILSGRPLRPLLLVNAEWFSPDVLAAEPGEGWGERGLPVVSAYSLGGPLEEMLSQAEVPDGVVAMLVEAPQELGAPGTLPLDGMAIRGAMRGTLGPRLEDHAQDFYLTAGHVTGPVGSLIERVRVRRLLRSTQYRPFGTVLARCVPQPGGLPDYDVAVVAPYHQPVSSPCTIARLNHVQTDAVPVTLNGGVSGSGYGKIQGALKIYSDRAGHVYWLNSWIMTPGDIGMEGDSGGSVVLDDGSVLGILVGGSRVKGRRSYDALYVQDLEATLLGCSFAGDREAS
jgi:hypothetical protein